MSWDRRLREIVFAGGAVATAACGGSTERSTSDAGITQSADATTDQGDDSPASNSCCNTNPDPCCSYECGGPMTAACAQELAECRDAGGQWNSQTYKCDVPRDAGAPDADSAALDAPSDSPGDAPGGGG